MYICCVQDGNFIAKNIICMILHCNVPVGQATFKGSPVTVFKLKYKFMKNNFKGFD